MTNEPDDKPPRDNQPSPADKNVPPQRTVLERLADYPIKSYVTLIAFAVIALLPIVFGYGYFGYGRYGAKDADSKAAAVTEFVQTEAGFLQQDEIKNSSVHSDVRAEWRAARGDHKIVAYAIASCQKIREQFGNIDTMPRQLFNTLLLDLTPEGEHRFSSTTFIEKPGAQTASVTSAAANNAAKPLEQSAVQTTVSTSQKPIELTSYHQSMLFLSDAIGRARLSAAAEASRNLPDMRWFGWVTVCISALGTLLVTVKGSMSAPKDDAAPSRRFWYVSVGVAAIVISAIGTTLASVKQFYDPARTYKTSEAARLELRKLHTKVAFEFVRDLDLARCAPTSTEGIQRNLNEWSQTLASVQASLIMASANLQDTDRIKLEVAVPNGQEDRKANGRQTVQSSTQ